MPIFGSRDMDEEEEEEEEGQPFAPFASWRTPAAPAPRREEEALAAEVDPISSLGLGALGEDYAEPTLTNQSLAEHRATGTQHVNTIRSGLLLDDDEDDVNFSGPPPVSNGHGRTNVAVWQQVLLSLFIFAGILAAASDRKPKEQSFQELRYEFYVMGKNATVDQEDQSVSIFGIRLPDTWNILLKDRSFFGRVVWSRYVDHGPFALAIVRLKSESDNKSKKAYAKIYEHKYLGVFGTWIPLPYLPQPGHKPGYYGIGACVLGRCVCAPKLRKPTASKKLPTAKSEQVAKQAGSECWRFKGDKSAALNMMAVPNIILFGFWQFPKYWAVLGAHATVSIANLARGRLWVLLSSPFSHRQWGEAFQIAMMLSNTLDSFDRAGVSFSIFLFLYLCGSWAAWIARGVFYRRLLMHEPGSLYTQEWGAAGGLAAQLLFLARIRPDERFQFSLYMMPIPVELSAWQSCFAHGMLDIVMNRGALKRQLLAHVAAWATGWAFATAWLKHA